MSSNNLFRIGGIAAIASAVLYLVSLGVQFTAIGAPSKLGNALYIASSLFFLVVIVVLYMVLRSEAAALALMALVGLGGITIWSIFIDPTAAFISPVFGPLTLAYGIGFIIFGWLQYRGSQYPKGIGILAVITGVLNVIMAMTLFAGTSMDIVALLNLILGVPYVIWLIWLGQHWLAGRTTAADDTQEFS